MFSCYNLSKINKFKVEKNMEYAGLACQAKRLFEEINMKSKPITIITKHVLHLFSSQLTLRHKTVIIYSVTDLNVKGIVKKKEMSRTLFKKKGK